MANVEVEKKVKNFYFRNGDDVFIVLAMFAFAAKKQNWNNEEIKKVLTEARMKDYEHMIKVLCKYSTMR